MTVKSNTLVFILAVVLLIIYCTLFRNALGGADLSNYKAYSQNGLSSWSFYELKEFVSWFIIKLSYSVSWSMGYENAIPFLVFISCITLSAILPFRYSVIMVLLLLMTSFGVLLSQNVLRQFIAAIFLYNLYTLTFINKGKFLAQITWGSLAVLSHNSSLIIIFLFILSSQKGIMFYLYCIVILPILIITNNLGILNYGSGLYEDNSGISENVKVMFFIIQYFILLFLLYNSGGMDNNKRLARFYTSSFIILILIYFLGFPYWAINRLFMTLLVLLSCHVTYLALVFQNSRGYIPLLLSSILMLPFLIFHSGAMRMLS